VTRDAEQSADPTALTPDRLAAELTAQGLAAEADE
jgi:hypothetical protein